jgi:hypothetical protein
MPHEIPRRRDIFALHRPLLDHAVAATGRCATLQSRRPVPVEESTHA